MNIYRKAYSIISWVVTLTALFAGIAIVRDYFRRGIEQKTRAAADYVFWAKDYNSKKSDGLNTDWKNNRDSYIEDKDINYRSRNISNTSRTIISEEKNGETSSGADIGGTSTTLNVSVSEGAQTEMDKIPSNELIK